MNGDDFLRATIELLAKRAGYICSNPACEAKTIGPSDVDRAKSVSVGVAAHITASRVNGPRYNPNLTPAERRSGSNGIWLCQTCSRRIDVNNGVDHSVETLRKWKLATEKKAAETLGMRAVPESFELGGVIEASGVGEIVGADIRRPTRIQPGTHVSASGFGKITAVRIGGKDD